MLETIYRRQLVKALMTTIVLQQGRTIRPYRGLFVVEVSVSVDDFTAFVTTRRCLPGEVLELRLDIASMMAEDEFRPQLLAHEFLGRRHPRGRPQTLFQREHSKCAD